MKFAPLLFTVALVRAIAVDFESHGSPETRDEDALFARSKVGSTSCTYGDPLHGSSEWVYAQDCLSTSSCEDSPYFGFSVKGFCDGGNDNQCCTIADCAAPYNDGNSFCANADTYHQCEHWVEGYCPGPNNYKCCTQSS